ncbi:MAG: UbiA family prenyltransferase [bacterium]
MSISISHSMLQSGFWSSYWVTMRPYLLFVSGAAGAVGLSFIPNLEWTRGLPAFLVLFLSYGFGQALTDCFQTDTDALSSPYRPLIRGAITRRQVLMTSLAGLSLSAVILAWLNPIILLVSSAAVFGLLTYTFFKRHWWGGPFWNSWIVALLPVIGCLSGSESHPTNPFQTPSAIVFPFWASVATIFFGYANFVVMGYFKDISADRKTGYRTLPVVFGWKAAAFCSDTLALATVLCACLFVIAHSHVQPLPVVLLAVGIFLSIRAQRKIHRVRDEKKTYKPISHVVRVFLLYGLAIIVSNKPSWSLVAAIYYLLFEVALRVRPEEAQV